MLAQGAQGVADVLQHRLKARRAARVAAQLFGVLDAAEREACTAECVLGREASADILLGLALDVKAQLVVELALDDVAAQEGAQAVAEVAQKLVDHVSSREGTT